MERQSGRPRFLIVKQLLGEENVTFELLPATDHGGPNYQTKENPDKVFTFLDRILKGTR